MALLCQGQVVFEPIELAWLIDFRSYFACETLAGGPQPRKVLAHHHLSGRATDSRSQRSGTMTSHRPRRLP